MNWYIGCSGFHYKEWKGIFYPDKLAQKNWFAHYATRFNTLELNVTFYRFPQVRFLKNWYEKSPPGFLFSIKVPRLITHYKQFKDVERMLSDFYGTVTEGLAEKAGPVLYQLPAISIYNPEKLSQIIACMNTNFQNVVEFRDKSWWKKKVFKELAENNISFCGSSFPGLPEEPVINHPIVYYRFHGIPVLYRSSYSARKLRSVAETIRKKKKVTSAFIYFNNTATAAALNNASYLDKLVEKGVL
jgi:uncharacterized protein YecE (DUF72 family)